MQSITFMLPVFMSSVSISEFSFSFHLVRLTSFGHDSLIKWDCGIVFIYLVFSSHSALMFFFTSYFHFFSFYSYACYSWCLFRSFHIILFRSHLREIRDRSVLRLFESNEVTAPQALPGGTGVPQPLPQNAGHWDQDQVIYHSNSLYIYNCIWRSSMR